MYDDKKETDDIPKYWVFPFIMKEYKNIVLFGKHFVPARDIFWASL